MAIACEVLDDFFWCFLSFQLRIRHYVRALSTDSSIEESMDIRNEDTLILPFFAILTHARSAMAKIWGGLSSRPFDSILLDSCIAVYWKFGVWIDGDEKYPE